MNIYNADWLHVKYDTVLGWIHTGELRALSVAAKPNGKPRWRIAEHDLEAFLLRRSASPTPKSKRRRRKAAVDVITYF